MKEWGVKEWYPVLTRGKNLVFVDEWTLYQSSEDCVQLIRCSGEMCKAEVEADGVCRVRADAGVLPLPSPVADIVREMLSLN